MSLREALVAIQNEHHGKAWVGDVIECQCPDRQIFPDKAAHAAHVVDLQVAYLRDNIGRHPEFLADLTIHQRRLITRIAAGWGLSYDYHRFDDIPVGTTFADRYGRVHTKTSAGVASEHSGEHRADDWSILGIDTSREYLGLDEDDDPSVFDAWPYYRLESTS